MREVDIIKSHGQEVRLCKYENKYNFILNVCIKFFVKE